MKRRLEILNHRNGMVAGGPRRCFGGVSKKNTKLDGLYTGVLVYVKLIVLWLCIMGGDFLLEFRLEYLYPVYLLLHNGYEAYRFQGVAFTLLLVCIVVSVDIICIGTLPPHLVPTLGSIAVWSQLTYSLTPLGPVLILPLLYYTDLKIPHTKYTPIAAAHCLGFPLVSIGFAFKSYLSAKWKRKLKGEVAVKNEFLYSLLWDALPLALTEEPLPQPAVVETQETPPPVQKVETKKPVRRKSMEELNNNPNGYVREEVKPQPPQRKHRARPPQPEDCCYKSEMELRRLKAELQLAKSTEQELRGQLQSQSHVERSLRADVVALQSELELLEGKYAISVQKATEERVGLEKRVQEERRAKELAVGKVKKANSDCPGDCRRKLTTLTSENNQLKTTFQSTQDQLQLLQRELQNVKSTLLHEQKSKESCTESTRSLLQSLQEQNAHLEQSLNAETKLKLDLFGALGEARRELTIRDGFVKQKDEELEELRAQLQYVLLPPNCH